MEKGVHTGHVSDERFMEAVERIRSAETVRSLVDSIPDILNVAVYSYHHFPSARTSAYKNLSQYYAYGMPQIALDYYDRNIQRRNNPGIIAALEKGQFIWLTDMPFQPYVIERGYEDAYKRAYNAVGEGLSIPLYGPGNRKGCLFIAVAGDLKQGCEAFPYKMQALAQLLHIRYCLLTEKLHKHVQLTARESEVLDLITFGKSNVEIGLILKISPNTVAVYVKRIFIKLDVSDRVSAAMRAQTMKI